jgi:hypothetical protein
VLKLGEPIFQYTENDVGNEQLLNIHVRGSSAKGEKKKDRNQKLVVFFQHSSNIYSWILKNESSKTDQIFKVSFSTSR